MDGRNDDVPPVPANRIEAGYWWHQLWERAHREMAPWGWVPSPYLIDQLLGPKTRHRFWLSSYFGAVAQETWMREHDFEEEDGVLRWYVDLPAPTRRCSTVRVLANPARGWIFNVFPDRGRTR